MQSEEKRNNILQSVEKTDNFKFSENTTYGLGGYAKCAYFPKTEEEVAAVLDYLTETGEKFEVLGAGSNILASDGYFNGSVICTKRLKEIKLYGDKLYCESGVTVKELLNFCKENGVGGLEYLAGIPATLGGLTIMNGGIPARHIGDDIVSVNVYEGKFSNFDNKTCNFGNKRSTMRNIHCVITGLNLSISAVPREAVQEKIKTYLNARSSQPSGRNCGCVFKNPKGLSAGKLIDEAGLKGLKIGGAEVADFHANFILNNGGTADDVYRLIKEVKKRVYSYSGVELEEEVVYIGEFNDFNS